MRPSALLARLLAGTVTKVTFVDAQRLVEALGFELLRASGSHHVYAHDGLAELVLLQDRNGQAKPYQLRQLTTLVRRYDLRLEDNR